MKKTTLFLCISLFTVWSLTAQEVTKAYWKSTPVIHTAPEEFAKQPAVIVEENFGLVYKDEDDKQVWMYITTHRIAKILDEKGIDNFNKLTISIYSDETLVELKARTILANGSVTDIPKDKMKESKDDDGNTEIAVAMNGVEKNAEVEYVYTYKKPASFFGRQFYQFSVPVIHASFDLESPARLQFEEKGYSGFPTSIDTLIENKRIIHAEQSKIPAIQHEQYSFLDIDRENAVYKLSYLPDENKDKVRKYTWQDLSKRIYGNIYVKKT